MREYRPIRGREPDGSYSSPIAVRIDAAWARRTRLDAGYCLNGTSHGAATHGVRCFRCSLVHAHGVVIARSMPEYKAARPVPVPVPVPAPAPIQEAA